jgi:hypothetical protein
MASDALLVYILVDSKFLLTIFANESNKVMRYTDEGEMSAVFQWIIDLSTLPAFSQNANMHESGGFYTGNF